MCLCLMKSILDKILSDMIFRCKLFALSNLEWLRGTSLVNAKSLLISEVVNRVIALTAEFYYTFEE